MNTNIEKEFLAKYIVPNFYEPEHFEKMENWNQEKIEKFKEFMIKSICYDDCIKKIVENLIDEFEEEESESEELTEFCCEECKYYFEYGKEACKCCGFEF